MFPRSGAPREETHYGIFHIHPTIPTFQYSVIPPYQYTLPKRRQLNKRLDFIKLPCRRAPCPSPRAC